MEMRVSIWSLFHSLVQCPYFATLDSTMQPLVWLPAVVLVRSSPAARWECYGATSCHVRIPSLWLISVHALTSSVHPQQAIHMLNAHAGHCFSYSAKKLPVFLQKLGTLLGGLKKNWKQWKCYTMV